MTHAAPRPGGPEEHGGPADDRTAPTGTAEDDLAPAELATIRAEARAEVAAERAARNRVSPRETGVVALIGGAVALFFAFVLSVDKITLTENADASLGCDINPFVSCGNVILTPQASAFGVPNPFLGLIGYALVVTYGVLLLARVQLPRWFHLGALGGMVFAFGFIHWLAYQSLFEIRSLCPWCLVVWVATAAIFFHVLARTAQDEDLPVPRGVASVLVGLRWIFAILWCVAVAGLILVVFWDQWLAVWGI